MPFGWLGAEALLAAGDEMAGERDLGHEHQRLLALRERCGDRLEIDFGLAGAGDAVEQSHGEAVLHIGEELGCRVRLLRREPRPRRREVELWRRPGGKLLGDQRAGIDQPVDHAGADAGGFGERRLRPGHAVARDLQHAGAGRRHARWGAAFEEPHAIARRRRREGAARAHHHAQHHARRAQRVSRHPIGEVERDARQRRHVVDHLDDLAQLLGIELRRLGALVARPHHAEIVHRRERRHDELTLAHRHALRHGIVVRRRQRERQQYGDSNWFRFRQRPGSNRLRVKK